MPPEHDSDGASPRPVALAAELDEALAREEFFLVYQPTIDLQTRAFVGVEALLRWRSPSRGVEAPDAFLPELEATGAIVQVGAWVLDTACRQGADWHARGHRFTVSVNVSPGQFGAASLVEDVDRALTASDFDPGHLVLEVSEHVLTSDVDARGVLARLKAIGVRLAVDDFGAAPGGEEAIATFPIDIVKIDRACTSNLSASADGAARVHDLVQLGKSLHVQTIAQGIEDDDQRLRMLGEDVDVGQGYFFAVPHAVADIDRFLEDYAIFSGKPL